MWKKAAAAVALLASLALVACGGEGEKCDSLADLRTRADGPVPVLSVEDAQRRADFEIVVPVALPEGVAVDGVALVGSACPDGVGHVQVLMKGPDWAFTIDELAGDRPQPLESSTPTRINGVVGQLHRRTNTAGQVVSATWTDGERVYVATALLRGGLTEQSFVRILQAIPD